MGAVCVSSRECSWGCAWHSSAGRAARDGTVIGTPDQGLEPGKSAVQYPGMSSSFRFVALPYERFASLFGRSDEELAAIGARRMEVDDKPGFPCRVSLMDAEVGETVVLLSFTHHDTDSPYRAAGPIFVRQGAATATPAPGEVPLMFRHRLLSVRGYDAGAMLIDCDVVNGSELEDAIARMFADEKVRYLHLHNARPGCFNCSVVRTP